MHGQPHIRNKEVCKNKEKRINMNLRCILTDLDGPDLGWCPMLDFDTSGVGPSASAVTQLV